RSGNELQASIKYRPKQLEALLSVATWDEIEAEAFPIIAAQKIRATPKTEAERARGIRIAKNRYERNRRGPVSGPGLIEQQFADQPHSFLLDSINPPQPSGPCLDEIFHGGAVKMCDDIIFHGGAVKMCDDMYSLQSLFGLSRKKLSGAGSGTRRGREIFYDY